MMAGETILETSIHHIKTLAREGLCEVLSVFDFFPLQISPIS
jgi:hypothetical protein